MESESLRYLIVKLNTFLSTLLSIGLHMDIVTLRE